VQNSFHGFKFASCIFTLYIRLPSYYFAFLSCLKAGLRVRVNFRESYREHLATTFKRESKCWLAGSLRSLLRAPEL
jgi:hypothetical protein